MIFAASGDRIQCRFGRGDVELGHSLFFFFTFEDQKPREQATEGQDDDYQNIITTRLTAGLDYIRNRCAFVLCTKTF